MSSSVSHKYQFSGHESFVCKHLWLKKGFDFLTEGKKFMNDKSVVDLGVGKNMVNSILYWMKSYGLLDDRNKPNEFATYLFGKRDGVDKYVENLATIWLLHYQLIQTNKASIYNLFFNEFRKGRNDFTKEQLVNFVRRILENQKLKGFNLNTVSADVSVFIRSYLKPKFKETKVDIEEDFSSLMIDLDLMSTFKAENAEGKLIDWFRVESKEQLDLPAAVVLFSILDNPKYGKSISFQELLTGNNSPGSVFALNEAGLLSKIESICSDHKYIIFTESAGIRELQFKRSLDKYDVLNAYYN
jgi:hypothetical protein